MGHSIAVVQQRQCLPSIFTAQPAYGRLILNYSDVNVTFVTAIVRTGLSEQACHVLGQTCMCCELTKAPWTKTVLLHRTVKPTTTAAAAAAAAVMILQRLQETFVSLAAAVSVKTLCCFQLIIYRRRRNARWSDTEWRPSDTACVADNTLAFGRRFESRARLYFNQSASAFSKLRSLK